MALPERSGRKMAGNAGGIRGSRMPGQNPLNAPISRSQFIKAAGIGAAGVAAAGLGLGGVARAVPTILDVWPKNDPYYDIPAIQNAINSANPGDTILLHATATPGGTDLTPFNLGSPVSVPGWTTGTILVDRGVTITGEAFNSAISDRTVINGGFVPFFIDTAGAADPVNFNMLDGRSPGFCFLYYHACNGASVTEVNINTVVPGPPPGLWNCPPPCVVYQAYSRGFANGVYIGNNFDFYYGIPPRIFGDINIENCKVDYANSADALDMATLNGIRFASYDANITVHNCQFYNFSTNGIEAASSAGSGLTIIDGCEFNTTKATKGSFGLARLCSAIHIGLTSENYTLSNNLIFMDGRGYKDIVPTLKGFHIAQNTGSDKTIETNSITTYGDGAFPVWIQDESNVQCLGNTIMGAGYIGIDVFYGSSSNEIRGNILTGFTSIESQMECWGDPAQPSFGFPSYNTFENNLLGPSNGWAVSCSGTHNAFVNNTFGLQLNAKMAAAYCDGNSNTFSDNDFTHTDLKGFNVSSTGISRAGCVFLEYGTSGNTVNVAVSQLPPLGYPWYDPCTQVADVTYDATLGYGANPINWTFDTPEFPGPCPCNKNQWDQLIHMLDQYSDYKELKAEMDALLAGYAVMQ